MKKKPFSENLRDFIRDATPEVPAAWVIFWLGGLPKYLNYSIFWCVLYFIAILLLTCALHVLGELVAYDKPRFEKDGTDQESFSLWKQFYRLVFLLLALGWVTIMIKG